MPDSPHFNPSRPVVLLPYQPGWASEFAALAQRLRDAAGPGLVGIDHIGSTAVPGLCAKDVLDVQLRVPSLASAASLTQRLRAAGFQRGEEQIHDIFHGLPPDSPELSKLYMREPAGERRLHLHIREAGRFNARYALLFRDYMRANPPARQEYGELKRRAAAVFPHSIDGYLFLKEPVFHLLYQAAELWADKVGWQPAAEGDHRASIDRKMSCNKPVGFWIGRFRKPIGPMYLTALKQRKRRPLQDELTEAMHSEFTVDEETDRRHRVQTARKALALGLLTPAEAAEVYGLPLAEIVASDSEARG